MSAKLVTRVFQAVDGPAVAVLVKPGEGMFPVKHEPEIDENGLAVVRLEKHEVGFLLGCIDRAREETPKLDSFMNGLRSKLAAFYPWPDAETR